MKTILFLILPLYITMIGYDQQETTQQPQSFITIQPEENGEQGRCTGASDCKICKNCSGCKHCAYNGGSCGVCSSQKHTIGSKYSKGDSISITEISQVYKKPDTSSEVIQTVLKGADLIYIDAVNGWMKIKVEKSGLIGYISAQSVQ